MSKWREVRLKDIADINMGQSPKSEYYNFIGEGLKFLQGNRTFGRLYPTYDTYTSKITKVAEKDDILISVRAPVGDLNLSNDKLCLGRGVAGIRSKEKNLFLFYSLIYNMDSLKTAENGTTYGSINKSDLESFKLQIPDLETQEKIAVILSIYDELIENNNRRIEILEKTAEEIYKEWFVRMRFPGYEKTKFIKGIPEGWEVKKLGDLLNVTSSKRIYSSEYVEVGVPFYRSKEVIQLFKGESISNILYITKERYLEIKEKFGIPLKDDILITSVGTIGVPMLVKDEDYFYFKDGNITWIQSSSKPELAIYLYLWIKSDIGQKQILSSTIGTSQSALTIEKLKKIKNIFPEKQTLLDFNEIIKNIQQSINNLNIKNQNLIKQRDLLLPRLMNGTIEVK